MEILVGTLVIGFASGFLIVLKGIIGAYVIIQKWTHREPLSVPMPTQKMEA